MEEGQIGVWSVIEYEDSIEEAFKKEIAQVHPGMHLFLLKNYDALLQINSVFLPFLFQTILWLQTKDLYNCNSR